MWIVKPIQALSSDEAFLYSKFYQFPNFPVAQTLPWGKAALEYNQEIIVVLNDEMQIAGINLINNGILECVNGPVFNLKEDKYKIDQKVATYVYSIAQIYPSLKKIILRPRFSEQAFSDFEQKSTFPFDEVEQFKTLVLDLNSLEKNSEVKSVEKFNPQVSEIELDQNFYNTLLHLAEKKEFYVPPFEWFEKLIQKPNQEFKLWKASSEFKNSYILSAHIGQKVYYLFACEEVLEKKNLSLNMYLIYYLIDHYKSLGVEFFDFHGIEFSPDQDSSFSGVQAFKSKFGGEEQVFLVPELIFENE